MCSKEGGRRSLYLGETSRSLHERQTDHAKNAVDSKKHDTSHMQQHGIFHEGIMDFKYNVLRTHRSAFERQVSEAICIRLMKLKGINILNNKKEYNRCLLPELVVELGNNKKKEKQE